MVTTDKARRPKSRRLWASFAALTLLTVSAGAQAGINVDVPLAGVNVDRGGADISAPFTQVRAGHDRRDRRGYRHDKQNKHDKRKHRRRHGNRHNNRRYGHRGNRHHRQERRAERRHHNRRFESRRGRHHRGQRRHHDRRHTGHRGHRGDNRSIFAGLL